MPGSPSDREEKAVVEVSPSREVALTCEVLIMLQSPRGRRFAGRGRLPEGGRAHRKEVP